MNNLYNQFNYSNTQWQNSEFILKEFQQLKEHGTNLNLPVLSGKHLTSFKDFISEKNSSLYLSLMEKDLIDNMFDFKVEGNIVKEGKVSILTMKKNFTQYEPLILKAITKLSEQLESLSPINQLEFSGIKGDKKILSDAPALYSLASLLSENDIFTPRNKISNEQKFWDVLLSHNTEIKEYMKYTLQKNYKLEDLLSIDIDDSSIGKKNLAAIFYKHDLCKTYFNNNPQKIVSLVYSLIDINDVKSIKDLMPLYQKSKKFNPYISQGFLKSSKSKEMAQFLLEQGCPFALKEEDIAYKGNRVNFALDGKMPIEVIRTILNYKASHQEAIRKNPEEIFDIFFQKSNNFDIMQLLVKEYNFSIKSYDMFKVASRLDKSEFKHIKWFLNNGANPAICYDFLYDLSREQNSFKKLKKYQDFMDIYSSDFIYNALKVGGLKDYETSLSREMLDKKTIDGIPVWWGCRVNGRLINDYINNTTSKVLETEKDSWLGHMFLSRQFLSAISLCNQYKDKFNNPESFSIKINEKKNIFHYMFKSEKSYVMTPADIEVHSQELDFILNSSTLDIPKELLNKDENGMSPLKLLFEVDDYDPSRPYMFLSTKRYQVIRKIVKHLDGDFPFEEPINNDNCINLLRKWMKDDDTVDIESIYSNYKSKKLNSILPEKNATRKVKI